MTGTGISVRELWRYPVKSMAGESLDTATVTELGIAGDRGFGLVDADTGLVLTARRVPPLLFARVVVDERGTTRVELPDGTVTDDADELSAWLGRRVELRRPQPDESGTYEIAIDDDDPSSEWVRWQGPVGVFHDSTRTRVSIIAASGLGDWDVRRFRPNVVIDGGDERELLGHRIRIGTAEFDVVKEIDRCVVVTRPQPGLVRDTDVLRRVHRERNGNLGVAALVHRTGTVEVGDPVEVIG